VAVLNRGQTPDDLPREVERLRSDRTDPRQLKQVLGGRDFDLVVDTTLYIGAEAETVVELLAGRVGHYMFLSTGQVYLVRIGVERPFKEDDYAGPVMPEPPRSDEYAHSNWLYGFDKRAAEDVFTRAWTEQKFPVTSLRLPMVNSERDHYDRIYGYILRLLDGGPVLVPEDGNQPVRHVYGDDVVQAVLRVASMAKSKGRAFNFGQDETLSLEQFLEMLAELMGKPLKVARLSRPELQREGLLPHCSPFSGKWMSSLDNSRSIAELGIAYTPMRAYLKKLVDYYQTMPARAVEGYAQREKELELVKSR